MARIATCGGLMIAANSRMPKVPRLETVNVRAGEFVLFEACWSEGAVVEVEAAAGGFL